MPRKTGPTYSSKDFSYKGYFVQSTIHGWEISKDKFHISWAGSAEEARKIIDGLTENPVSSQYTFHGKFKSKILAARKEREIPGSFILRKGEYYFVLKPKRNPFRLGSRRVRPVKSMRSPIRGRRKVTYRKKSVALRHTNPGTLIYSHITRIEGTKGKGSAFPGQKFFHKFHRPYPAMYGLKDGSLLIK